MNTFINTENSKKELEVYDVDKKRFFKNDLHHQYKVFLDESDFVK
jgi:hypothetical protein